MKDLKKYRDMPDVFHTNPQFFTTYPELSSKAARTMLTVDGVDKKTKEKRDRQKFHAQRRRCSAWWAMRSSCGGHSNEHRG